METNSLRQVLTNALKKTFSGAVYKWLFGSASTLIALLLLAKNFFNYPPEKSFQIGIYLIICLIVVRFIWFSLGNLIRFAIYTFRESIHGDAIIVLRDSFSTIHYLRKKDKVTDEDFMQALQVFCNNLKLIFDKKTKRKCSVSIKVPVKTNDKQFTTVYNLCRDSVATKLRDTDIYRKVEHTILGNTAYQKIVNNILKGNHDKLFYRNNDLKKQADYENTSKEAYPDGKLPYLSELVYPILPHIWDSKTNNFECLGFICVDCEVKDAFDEKYDVAIVSGVADGIYDTIIWRNQIKEKEHE